MNIYKRGLAIMKGEEIKVTSCTCGHEHNHEHSHSHKQDFNMEEQKGNNIRFMLKGLNCANCAAKIENALIEERGVKSAVINLMKQELSFVCEGMSSVEAQKLVNRAVKKFEPSVEVLAFDKNEEENEKEEFDLKSRIKLYAAGLAFFIAALFINNPTWLKMLFFAGAYIIYGFDVLKRAVLNIFHGKIFDENFLMAVSTIGAIAIGEMSEAVFVMIFYQIGETFQDLAVDRSRKSIKSLMDIRPDFAHVERNGELITVNPLEVKEGDIIAVKAGERIPLDGIVTEGYSRVDISALTGEPVPAKLEPGSEALSGSINTDGFIKIKVTREFGKSTVVKILELVENAVSKKSQTERFITKFAKIYTPVVVFAAVALAVIPPILMGTMDFKIWFSRALIFLVVSCPCALVLSVPLGFFAGIGEASKNGILIKGSNFMQALSEANTVVFDKTGTLTKGVFTVSEVKPESDVSDKELIKYAAMAEAVSNHPIAKAIINYSGSEYKAESYEELSGYGVIAVYEGKNIFVGNSKLMEKQNIKYDKFEGVGSIVYVAVDKKYMGRIVVSDIVKEDSIQAVKKLKSIGIEKTVMLTGDNKETAYKIGEKIGIDKVYAQLLPAEKVEKIEEVFKQSNGGKVIFAGDGINDAPVLARADVGIAMGGIGSDAAIEASDVVIMNDEPSKIADAVIIARNTNKIVKQNIVFAIGVKIIVLALSAVGFASMWMAVFADVGVAFIAILNSMRKKGL